MTTHHQIRQWRLLYDQRGTAEQLRVWQELADRQIAELERQRDELEASIADLRALRNAGLPGPKG